MNEEIGKTRSQNPIPFSIVVAVLFLSLGFIIGKGGSPAEVSAPQAVSPDTQNSQGGCSVAAGEGERNSKIKSAVLPVKMGDLLSKLISVGVIDEKRFEELYKGNPEVFSAYKKFLAGDNGNLVINEKNAGLLLNIFWADGLGTKNSILGEGPMMDKRYGGAGRFASTAGWTVSVGNSMDHYSRHPFAVLTEEEQKLVEKVAKGIYRPCCDNPVYFPDCNHGMAMLGLLELMASQGVSEREMWQAALTVNSFWFPDVYAAIDKYFESKGIDPKTVSAEEILGKNYSSASGFARVAKEIKSTTDDSQSGGGCSV